MRGRKNIRLKNYDYAANGYYFITIVTKARKDLFLGKEHLIKNQLTDTIEKISGTKLDYYTIMPNHVHLIIILQNCKLHLGEIIRRFKAKTPHILNYNVWQANYYEHVIRNEKALEKIREYIINNPQEILLEFNQFYQ